MTDATSGELVGSVGFGWVGEREEHVGEVGYWIRREARGRGLTTRAVRLVSEWVLRELGCDRLQLRADDQNVPSQRVAEKAAVGAVGGDPPGLQEALPVYPVAPAIEMNFQS